MIHSTSSRWRHGACCCFIAVLIVGAVNPHPAGAIDTKESLALLVRTLNETNDSAVQSAVMKGMMRGLEGRRRVEAPIGWTELSEKFASSDDRRVRELSLQLANLFGDRKAVERTIGIVRNTEADSTARRTALRMLLTQKNRKASELLQELLDDPAMRLDAIRGYASTEIAQAPALLLSRYKQLSSEQRRAVIETLTTRKSYAKALLTEIERKSIARDEIPAHVARSLHGLLGEQFVKVFGPVKSVAEDREKLIAKYKRLLTPDRIGDASASRGRVVFKKTCASCHLLYGDGAKIGPDLTGSNRANLDYILLNSVDPSFDVPASYKMVSIVTVEGRVLNGVVGEEDATRVVLKTVEQPRVVILKEDIETRSVSPKSMMPNGQLDELKRQEVADLIKYLRTTEQVEEAK